MNASESDVGKIRLVATQAQYYSHFSSTDPLNVDGYWSDIVNIVLQKFDWNYELHLEFNNTFDNGKIYGEGNGTGMIGVLARNESDVALNPTEMSPGDFRYLDYSPVTWERSFYTLSSEASTAKFHSSDFAFLGIYSPWVWLACGLSLFFFTVFLVIAKILLSTYPKNRHSLSSRNDPTGVFLNAYQISLNQSVELPPSIHGHLRLAVLSWVLACFVVNVGFTGGLLTKLTLPPKPIYIETLEDILKYPHLLIEIMKESDLEKIFQVGI